MQALAGIWKSVLGICETDPLDPALWNFDGNVVTVKVADAPQLAEKDGAAYIQGGGLSRPVLIVKTGNDQFAAFENRCTHMRRKLDPVPGEDRLRCCSISHSVFDMEGNVVRGLAKDPITRYSTEVRDGDLLITL